uniref:Uncharacterized protein n=1 Tax=Ascaris lumbricoides TaxID=6252 RepID=A0A9J2P325_ASCLU
MAFLKASKNAVNAAHILKKLQAISDNERIERNVLRWLLWTRKSELRADTVTRIIACLSVHAMPYTMLGTNFFADQLCRPIKAVFTSIWMPLLRFSVFMVIQKVSSNMVAYITWESRSRNYFTGSMFEGERRILMLISQPDSLAINELSLSKPQIPNSVESNIVVEGRMESGTSKLPSEVFRKRQRFISRFSPLELISTFTVER